MSLEDDLLRQRVAAAGQIAGLGFRPYGNRYETTTSVPDILKQYAASSAEQLAPRIEVRIAGRIQTIRRMGKAGFLHLQQQGERLQLYVRQDAVSDREWKLFQLLDLGDMIGAGGYLFRTKTGELSVHVEQLEFLSKILLTMPEKWHGLEDIETRYRQRYLDLIANPEVRTVFLQRAALIQSFRRQLEAEGFIEVETPMMQPLYGGAAARPFVTHHNTLDIDLYLRIAPELYLKRLIVGGLERVYEINRNFRNEGISTQHNPEFTMLEFYQAYADFRVLMDFSVKLLRQAATDVTGASSVLYEGQLLDFATMRQLTMREAIVEYWPGCDRPTLDRLRDPEWLQRVVPGASSPGFALIELFETHVEPRLVQPTIIYEYPVENSPLSKKKEDEPAFVDRFEIYAAGMEIGNAYTELNDPHEQRRRFESQRAERERGDEEAHAMDEDFLRALCYAMPPTAGEGIGIDRLTMIFTGSKSIRDVILFPLLRPEGELGIAQRLREAAGE